MEEEVAKGLQNAYREISLQNVSVTSVTRKTLYLEEMVRIRHKRKSARVCGTFVLISFIQSSICRPREY